MLNMRRRTVLHMLSMQSDRAMAVFTAKYGGLGPNGEGDFPDAWRFFNAFDLHVEVDRDLRLAA